MPKKDREWDPINYLDSTKDACGYLTACLQEEPGDGSLLRAALNDITRAQQKGKLPLPPTANHTQLLQSLTNTGHLPPKTAQKIAQTLAIPTPAANPPG